MFLDLTFVIKIAVFCYQSRFKSDSIKSKSRKWQIKHRCAGKTQRKKKTKTNETNCQLSLDIFTVRVHRVIDIIHCMKQNTVSREQVREREKPQQQDWHMTVNLLFIELLLLSLFSCFHYIFIQTRPCFLLEWTILHFLCILSFAQLLVLFSRPWRKKHKSLLFIELLFLLGIKLMPHFDKDKRQKNTSEQKPRVEWEKWKANVKC